MKKTKKITVIGGGNIGTYFACAFASKGYDVAFYVSSPEVFSNTLFVEGDSEDLSYSATINNITDDIEIALSGSDLVFVTYPSFMFEGLAKLMEPHIKKGVNICVLPGTGGAEFAFMRCLKKGAVLSGLQRVPAVVRLLEKGKRVSVKGVRDRLYLAAIPSSCVDSLATVLERVLEVKCSVLPNYLSITLTPSNPILHTTRLCSLFKNYSNGVFYKENPLFYESWDVDSSTLLFECDQELQNLCRKIEQETGLDLSGVKSLKEHYESNTPSELAQKIRSIKSFRGLLSPMTQTKDGWIPDFNNRYFTADFPYGLAIIKELSLLFGCNCKSIDHVMNWYIKVSGKSDCFKLENFDISSIKDIINLYSA